MEQSTTTEKNSSLKPKEHFTFPLFVDNSIVTTLEACLRKGYWQYFRHKVLYGKSPDLTCGAAYAKGLEVFRKNFYGENMQGHGSFEESRALGAMHLTREFGIEDAEDTAKTYLRTLAAYMFYFEEWPPATDYIKPLLHEDGSPAVEFSFAEPLEIKHPETGEPILYVGRFDFLGIMNDVLFIVDDKTTGSMGPTWAQRWETESQFSGYCWGAGQWKYPVAGAIIRGAAIQKTQIKFNQAITYRPKWRIERWYENLHKLLERAIKAWENEDFPTEGEFNGSCSSYGGCPYQMLCTSDKPEGWLDGNYMDYTWNPIDMVRK